MTIAAAFKKVGTQWVELEDVPPLTVALEQAIQEACKKFPTFDCFGGEIIVGNLRFIVMP